jgi:hypothetical protein
LLYKLREVEKRPFLQVFVCKKIGEYVLDPAPSTVVLEFSYENLQRVPRSYVSREADVWLIARRRADPSFSARYSEMISRFNLQNVWSSSGGEFSLYSAHVNPTKN